MSKNTLTITFVRTRHSQGFRLNVNGKFVALGAERYSDGRNARDVADQLLAKHLAARGLRATRTFTRWADAGKSGEWSVTAEAEPIESPAVSVRTPDLSTAYGRIAARDAATQAAHTIEFLVKNIDTTARFCAAATALRALNLPCAVVWSHETNLPSHIDVTDVNGNGLTLEWEAMTDGFEYALSGEDALAIGDDAEQ